MFCSRPRDGKSFFIIPTNGSGCSCCAKTMAALPPIEAMEKLIENLEATKTNAELLLSGLDEQKKLQIPRL